MPPETCKPIPFESLDFQTWLRLAQVLEPICVLSKPGDWRTLAHLLGYDTQFITYIQSLQKYDGSCTMELFRQYSKRSQNSVEDVMAALKNMQHVTAEEILQQVYPKLRMAYDRSLQANNDVDNNISTKRTLLEDKRHYSSIDQSCVKTHLPSPTVQRTALGIQKGQENSHHSFMYSNNNRWQHIQDTQEVPNKCDMAVLPCKGYSSYKYDTKTTGISSMVPEYDSIRDEQIEYDTVKDIYQNGISDFMNEEYVPVEVGLSRHIIVDHCDIGADVTSSQNSVTASQKPMTSSSVPFSDRHNVISLQKYSHIGEEMHGACGFQEWPTGMVNRRCQSSEQGNCDVNNVNNTNTSVTQQGSGIRRAPSRVISNPDDRCSDNSRQVRVFITYANDSQSHRNQVISLAEFLKKNSVRVNVDMYESRLMATDKVGWLEKRFQNADYILVCISERYRHDVEAMDEDGTISLDHSLNNKFIYKLMQTEYHERRSTNYRFVPLLFPGATKEDVPRWLQNTLIYNWPTQFEELFSFISQPDRLVTSVPKKCLHNGTHPTVIMRAYSSDSTAAKEVL